MSTLYLSVDHKSTMVKIFVINLKRSPERREAMIMQMDRYNLQYEFFDAVDGRELSSEVIEKSRLLSDTWYKQDEGPDQSMKLGEIGVAISHFKIYQKIISNNLELAIILEDDINFDERFEQIIKNSAKVKEALKHFDLVLMGYCTHDLNFKLPAFCSYWGRKRVSKGLYVGIPLIWYWSAIGYIITKKAAILLTEKQGEYPCVTSDILTANSPKYGVRLGVMSKPLIWPGYFNNFSTIQEQKEPEAALELGDVKSVKDVSPVANLIGSMRKVKNFLSKEKQKLRKKQNLFVKHKY